MGKSEAARTFGVSLSSVKRYVGKARQGSSLSPIYGWAEARERVLPSTAQLTGELTSPPCFRA
jgi:transposase